MMFNQEWPYIPDHPHRILIIGVSGSRKTKVLFDLINHQEDIDKINLYTKEPYTAKYHFLIKKREKVGLKHYNDSKTFIEHSNDMQDVYENIEESNPREERKVLIAFDDMIVHMISNKKLSPVATEIFARDRKLNIAIVFIKHSYFKTPKDVRLNTIYYFIMRVTNKKELREIALNHSSDIDFQDFINLYKQSTAEPYLLLVIDTNPDNPLHFKKKSFRMNI